MQAPVQQQLPLQWRRGSVDPVPRQPGPPDSTALQRWIARVSIGVAEVAAGSRPATNMHQVVTAGVLSKLRILHDAGHSRNNAPLRRTTSVRVLYVSPGTVEACAVVQGSTRCQAVALQLKQRGKRWIVTAVEIR